MEKREIDAYSSINWIDSIVAQSVADRLSSEGVGCDFNNPDRGAENVGRCLFSISP
jgi:hypothetical protein